MKKKEKHAIFFLLLFFEYKTWLLRNKIEVRAKRTYSEIERGSQNTNGFAFRMYSSVQAESQVSSEGSASFRSRPNYCPLALWNLFCSYKASNIWSKKLMMIFRSVFWASIITSKFKVIIGREKEIRTTNTSKFKNCHYERSSYSIFLFTKFFHFFNHLSTQILFFFFNFNAPIFYNFPSFIFFEFLNLVNL